MHAHGSGTACQKRQPRTSKVARPLQQIVFVCAERNVLVRPAFDSTLLFGTAMARAAGYRGAAAPAFRAAHGRVGQGGATRDSQLAHDRQLLAQSPIRAQHLASCGRRTIQRKQIKCRGRLPGVPRPDCLRRYGASIYTAPAASTQSTVSWPDGRNRDFSKLQPGSSATQGHTSATQPEVHAPLLAHDGHLVTTTVSSDFSFYPE